MANRTASKKPPPSLPAELREVAIALFAEFGYAATGIREIARRTGLSSAAMYHYLNSKQNLLFDLMHDSMQDQLKVAWAVMECIGDPELRIAELARRHVQMTATRQLEALVTENEIRALTGENRERIIAMRDEYAALWQKVILEGIKQGRFCIADVKVASFAVIEMCTSVSKWYLPHGPMTPEELSDVYAGYVLSILRGDPSAGPALAQAQKGLVGKRPK